MGYSREYVEQLEQANALLKDVVGREAPFDWEEHEPETFTTPHVEEVEDGYQYQFDVYDCAGPVVLIPPESFQPTEGVLNTLRLIRYAKATGHELRFTYKDKQRAVRVYDVEASFGEPVLRITVEGYDTQANDGRGGYRTFRFDRMEEVRLARP